MEHTAGAIRTADVNRLYTLIRNFRRIHRMYAAEIRDFHIQYNISRLILFSGIVGFISLLQIFLCSTDNPPVRRLFEFMVGFSLIVIGLILVLRRSASWRTSFWSKGLVHLPVTIFIIWGILLLQYSSLDLIQGIASFVTLIIGTAAIFILHPVYFFLLALISLAMLSTPLHTLYAPAFEMTFEELFLCVGIILISWVISVLHYLSTIELFLVRDEMQKSENMAELALNSGNLGYWNWDIDTEKIYVDERWFSILGYTQQGRVISFADFFAMIMPQDRQQLANRVQSYLEGREPAYTHHFRMQTSDGGWRWIYAQGQVTIRDGKGRPLGMHGIHQDIQEIQDRQKQLEESEERFKAYTENAPVGIFIVKDFHFIYINPEATRLTGYSQEELRKIKLLGIVHSEDRHDLVREVRMILERQILNSQYTYRIVGKSGDIHWVEVRVSLLERANPTFLLSVIDITARKDAEDRLKEYATFDELTGVYNRRVGITLLEQEMHHTKRERSAFTICFVDVNGLKTVNDTWGHDEGDALIKTVVDIIQSKLRRGDILCRLGGDEFLMMFKNCTLENAGHIWDRIEKKIDMVNKLTEKPYTISVSYGLLEHNHTMEKTVTELINMADQKMYDDKKAKRSVQVQRD